MSLLGRRKVINQTSFVDVSVVESITTTIRSTASIPLLESSTPTLPPTSESVSKIEESLESFVPTDPPSMFSTSMAPPRPTPADQEEELITTVAPTIREENEDTDVLTDFSVDTFLYENINNEEFVHPRGDTFQTPPNVTESTGATESMQIDEPEDHSVIEINTILPDVPIEVPSLITEPMFAEGKTEEAILDSGITTGMASDLTDTPTESVDLISEEVFSSSESVPSTSYDFNIDEIVTEVAQDLSSSTSESSSIIDTTTAIPATTTTYMCDTQPGSNVEVTTTEPPETTSTATQIQPERQDVETTALVHKEETTPATVTANIRLDSGSSAEDVSSSSSVAIFDESVSQFLENSGETITEGDTKTEIDTEYFTSVPMASAVAPTTITPGNVVTDEHSIQLTTVLHQKNVSGKTCEHSCLCFVSNLSVVQICCAILAGS